MDQTTNQCPCCNSSYNETEINCLGCNYPLQGTKQEKNFFTSEREVKQIELSDLSGKVASARKSLYVIAGLDAIFAIIMYFSAKNDTDKVSNLIGEAIVVAIFVGLGMWAKKKAKKALITGLIVFVTLHLLNAIINPMSLFSGLIFKIIVIVYLVKGIAAVSQADQLKKELNIA